MARPREFEPEEALDLAMRQFWAKGYHDTSVRDLVERTGVNQYGLYSVFRNKHELFLAALDRYRSTVTTEILEVLRRPGSARESIAGALERVLDLVRTRNGPAGCLMCNTAVELAPYDPDAAAKVRGHMDLLQDAFAARLADGVASGEFAGDMDVASIGEFLTTTVYGIGLLVRAGHHDDYVRRHITNALRLVA